MGSSQQKRVHVRDDVGHGRGVLEEPHLETVECVGGGGCRHVEQAQDAGGDPFPELVKQGGEPLRPHIEIRSPSTEHRILRSDGHPRNASMVHRYKNALAKAMYGPRIVAGGSFPWCGASYSAGAVSLEAMY